MALAMDGNAPKALMRCGVALLRLNKPGPASDRLAAASKAMPNDAELRKLLREAELKRSPTWVCASGCCGPWGIVCGGTVVSAQAVVAPRIAAENESKEPTKDADEETKLGEEPAMGEEEYDSSSGKSSPSSQKALNTRSQEQTKVEEAAKDASTLSQEPRKSKLPSEDERHISSTSKPELQCRYFVGVAVALIAAAAAAVQLHVSAPS
eukprot:TRINITY_DN19785_c0_g1_i2.p1 TRINITY_DN19785_c0_g1~~TRINITY_DN19785_c0_g1_i2.p1  ORF type:complete len:209 (-),score=61.66 TRINITY_DN19785_c0_g1_i2:81-707(-)